MMNNICCEQIDPYNPSSKVFGCNHKEKDTNMSILARSQFMHQSITQTPNFWNKWSWGLCVIPIWWITCSVNKLTYITYMVMYFVTIFKKNQICRTTEMPVFWNKWSWGLCVIPTWQVTYIVNTFTHISYPALFLVTIIKTKTHVCRFLLAYSFCTQVAPRCPDFGIKWSWGLCVIPTWQPTYNVNKLTHKTYLALYLVTIIKTKTQVCRFLLELQFMHPSCTKMPRLLK